MSRQMCQPLHPSLPFTRHPHSGSSIYISLIYPSMCPFISQTFIDAHCEPVLCSLSAGSSQEKDLIREKYGVSHNTSDNCFI